MSNFIRLSHREWIILIVLILVGLTLRAWQITDTGLDHFDEGVYAFSALGVTDASQPHRLYPRQILFSPPFYFSLVGLIYHILGQPSDLAAILVNVLLGTLTIVLVWWIGRTWFNPAAGIAAATLLTFNEYHILLSRRALTDVPFAFWFVLALAMIVTALRRQSVLSSMVAGLVVGLAWLTKYHGWLALVATGGALLPYSWCLYKRRQSPWRYFWLLSIMGGVAVICYLPWAWFIQSQPGGYAALALYHRRFLSKAWFYNFWMQANQQFFLEGVFSHVSVMLAVLLVLTVLDKQPRVTRGFLWTLALLTATSLLLGGAATAVLLTLLAIPLLLRQPTVFSAWLLLSWLGLWVFLTPLYRPYARLLLPFTIVTFLATGVWLSQVLREDTPFSWRPRVLTAGLALIVTATSLMLPDVSNPWRRTRSVADAAIAMQQIIPSGSRVIVVGEPELAFYLHLADRKAFERLEKPEDWEKLETTVYLVTGIYVQRVPQLLKGLEDLKDRLEWLGTFPMNPGDIRLLDDFSPDNAYRFRSSPDNSYDLTVYRLLPK
jgi:4-amino-4-deoxy-L-arabinose transferase-like glycosyltransferase